METAAPRKLNFKPTVSADVWLFGVYIAMRLFVAPPFYPELTAALVRDGGMRQVTKTAYVIE